MNNQCVSVVAGRSIERQRIHDARDHTVSMLVISRTVRCDVFRFKRVSGLECELRLVPDGGFIAGVRLYFNGAMPSVEARQCRLLRTQQHIYRKSSPSLAWSAFGACSCPVRGLFGAANRYAVPSFRPH